MSVEINKDSFIIENNIIGLILDVKGSKLVSSKIKNKKLSSLIEFESGSQEFVLCFKGVLGGELVKSSELKINNYISQDLGDKEKLVIEFKQFKIKGCKITVSLIYELGKLDFYLNKSLELSCEDEKGEKAILDYIDFEPFVIADSSMSWCLPEQEKSHISGFALSLGQPVFYQSGFFGCEFPASLNTIEENRINVKRYYGKSLTVLCGEKGSFVTDKAVVGVAPSSSYPVVRSAFLDYIGKISKRTKFRVQYNSWYDNFLDISKDNIAKSFMDIEKELNSVGMNALDCYVVDDGWNDYKSGFWRFNSKFPDELYSSSFLTQSLGSAFGLWLGPRGGYTKDTIKFARQIEAAGNGYMNKKAIDICVASDKYVNKVADLMLDYQSRFKLDYWKLDGFARKPCTDKKHDHIVGGKDNMYYYSELWEKWINVFSQISSDSLNSPHLNLTCYAPPSPWFLKWVNTVWLQCSDDMGVTKKFDDGRRDCGSVKDKLLTYRDGKYYEFYSERQFCFPAGNVYNHDPIYANKANVSMTDEEFRDYMFMNVSRGTQFFELYFSPNMMNEAKWRITNAALLFAKENASILQKTVMFGGKPTAGQIYGYAAFDGAEGIIALRNPDNKEKDYIFALDETVGADNKLFDAEVSYILPYGKTAPNERHSFKDTFRAVLKPYEIMIIHFGRKVKKLECVYKKARNENTLEVMFNQSVLVENVSCEENPIKNITLLEDHRSVKIEFKYNFLEDNTVVLKNVCDISGNSGCVKIDFKFYEGNLIKRNGISGDGDFTVKAHINGEYIHQIFSQGNDVSLYTRDGKVIFKVGETALSSRSNIENVNIVTAVRERNGVLKLYLDGKLDSGIRSYGNPYFIECKAATCFDESRVEVYDKAFAYDEI